MANKTKHSDGTRGSQVQLTATNIGGITRADIAISDGVTLLSGRNASNKSSLLRALAGALGGPVPPLKNDAESGTVSLFIDGDSYELQLSRRNGNPVVTNANVYTDREELCELFVALTETNPIRQAILTDGDLYEHLMRPVDTAEIQTEISRLSERKDTLEDELEELDAMRDRLPSLKTRRETLEDREAELEAGLRSKRDEVEKREAASEDTAEELQTTRAERSTVRTRIRTQEDAIASIETELEDVTAELAEQEATSADLPVENISAELDKLHQQKQEFTATINALSPIVDMNGRLLNGDADIPAGLQSDTIGSALNPDSQSVDCWTCGSTVERGQIVEQVETIEEIIAEKRNQRDDITTRIQSLTERRRELQQRADRIERLRERRDGLTEEREKRRERLEDRRSELRDLEADIEELQEATADDSESGAQLRELYDDISDLEYDRGSVVNELESVTSEIDTVTAELATRGDVEAELESVSSRLREQRQRIETNEQELVSTFNEIMQEVLDALQFDAIERVWLERRSSGNGHATATTFELHVVRENDDGEVYDDTVASLSKSEREVIGLVVALAGYLVHDVGDVVPFLVVDAVEMFDAERIDGLVDVFGDHAEFVVAAVLPEEGEQLAQEYETISTQSFGEKP